MKGLPKLNKGLITGKIGEPTWDTDTNQLRIHDGQTVGGHKETEHDWNKILQAAVGRV